MGFLKQFFKNVFDEGAACGVSSSFEQLSDEQLEAHLDVVHYGDFTLTNAVRPSHDLRVKPRQGYRHDRYHDEQTSANIPVVMASASREIVFDLFMDMLEPIGNVVDVVLETSHHQSDNGHTDLYREHIDLPVLKSILWDYEDLLVNDGCTGIAVLNSAAALEVQFDEHKLLIAYGTTLEPFETILQERDVYCLDQMKFITEAEHVHSSSDQYSDQFEELQMRLGMDSMRVDSMGTF